MLLYEPPCAFEDSVLKNMLEKQAAMAEQYKPKTIQWNQYHNRPLYGGVLSTDSKLVHIFKVGYGAVGETLITETVPDHIQKTLRVN